MPLCSNALAPKALTKKPKCNNNCMTHITRLRTIIVNKIVYVSTPIPSHRIRLRLSFRFQLLLSCVKLLEIVIVVFSSRSHHFSAVIAMCCEWQQNLGWHFKGREFIVSCSIAITLLFLPPSSSSTVTQTVLNNIMSFTVYRLFFAARPFFGHHESCKFIRWHYIVYRAWSDFSCFVCFHKFVSQRADALIEFHAFATLRNAGALLITLCALPATPADEMDPKTLKRN